MPSGRLPPGMRGPERGGRYGSKLVSLQIKGMLSIFFYRHSQSVSTQITLEKVLLTLLHSTVWCYPHSQRLYIVNETDIFLEFSCFFYDPTDVGKLISSSRHVWMWELDHKEGWLLKNWCFWTVVLEKTLESPLDYEEIKPVNPKGNQPCIFIERTDAEAEAPVLWPPDVKNWLIIKDPDTGKDWRWRRSRQQRTITIFLSKEMQWQDLWPQAPPLLSPQPNSFFSFLRSPCSPALFALWWSVCWRFSNDTAGASHSCPPVGRRGRCLFSSFSLLRRCLHLSDKCLQAEQGLAGICL